MIAPLRTRAVPTSRTSSVPSVGSASMAGSNTPRVRPTATLASRSRAATSANRTVSCSSRPRALTTSAPSKLSWATAETSARSCWAYVTRGDIRRWYTPLITTSAGNTASPMRASTGSVTTIATAATTSITTTPRPIGNGAKTFQVASTSAFALDSSWPVGWLWCQESGSERYCRVTSPR